MAHIALPKENQRDIVEMFESPNITWLERVILFQCCAGEAIKILKRFLKSPINLSDVTAGGCLGMVSMVTESSISHTQTY